MYALSGEYSLVPIHKLYIFINKCEYKAASLVHRAIATIAMNRTIYASTNPLTLLITTSRPMP
jgi:hypothetical protein